jgi:hypothetical protein
MTTGYQQRKIGTQTPPMNIEMLPNIFTLELLQPKQDLVNHYKNLIRETGDADFQ